MPLPRTLQATFWCMLEEFAKIFLDLSTEKGRSVGFGPDWSVSTADPGPGFACPDRENHLAPKTCRSDVCCASGFQMDFKRRSLEVTWHLVDYCCCLLFLCINEIYNVSWTSRGLPILLGSEALDLQSDTLAFSVQAIWMHMHG